MKTLRTVGVPGEIQAENLPNESQQRYGHISSLGTEYTHSMFIRINVPLQQLAMTSYIALHAVT
jgi:hypothetical protein